MKTNEYDAPVLSDAETVVLRMLCRYYMLEKPFSVQKVALHCQVPSWIIKNTLKSLIKRNLVRFEDGNYIPAMQVNGAPIPKPAIRFEKGVKVYECPPLYARGYAKRGYL